MSEIGKGWLLIPILDKLFFNAVWCSCSYLVQLLQLNWKSTQAAVAALLQCDAMCNAMREGGGGTSALCIAESCCCNVMQCRREGGGTSALCRELLLQCNVEEGGRRG